jgi:S-adenosylmethionine:tRNA ribosyltransferase-isomerase
MLTSDLDFHLPVELIAQTPHEPRDQSRLLHLRRGETLENAISHRRVCDLPAILRSGDLLVFNDTRVLRARLRGRRKSGGKIEALLLRETARNDWRALLKPSARLRIGERVYFATSGEGDFCVEATLTARKDSEWHLQFHLPDGENLRDCLPCLGEVPVPPYIQSAPREEQYQTVYAQNSEAPAGVLPAGVLSQRALDSCAAPTAGLHFSQPLLGALRERGVQTAFLTLGVGVGTFRPVQSETLEEHEMHREEFFVSEEAARIVNAQRKCGRRVIAVGTTTVRVLESVCDENGMIAAGAGDTAIFIRPGFRFRCVDALMTNFHLPRSTLLALVAAFLEAGASAKTDAQLTGLQVVHYAYAHAIAEKYRFFSFGDAMLIE